MTGDNIYIHDDYYGERCLVEWVAFLEERFDCSWWLAMDEFAGQLSAGRFKKIGVQACL